MRWALVLVVVAACGGRGARRTATPAPLPEAKTVSDRIVNLLPPGAQIVVEIDLARLRANPVVGETFTKVLAAPPDFPSDLPSPPL
ncbi:MAG TPA: hypothetical protein VK427_03920, partial [Kofleriaceae bacterium]|nr:hypothetical protein [Kofleriaceae bacterium]